MRNEREPLVSKRKLLDDDMCKRVHRAIDELVESGITPSFYSVAELAGIARSTLYRKDDLRRLVEEARCASADLKVSWREALKRLEADNESLRGQVAYWRGIALANRQIIEKVRARAGMPRFEYAICNLKEGDLAA